MTELQYVTYGTEVWARGSRGRAGSFSENGYPYIRDMRVRADGSLVVRSPWTRRLWHSGSSTFQDMVGHTTSSDFAVCYMTTHRADVFSSSVVAAVVMDTGGIKVFDTTNITSPLTELESDTLYKAITQYGFGYLDVLGRYQAVAQGVEVKSEGHGLSGAAFDDSRANLVSTFSTASNSILYVGSTIHQGRQFFWGIEYETTLNTRIRHNRIWYSDPYDYDNFTANTQWFEVDGEVRGAISMGPNLLIWTSDGKWFILQGRGDPADATLHSRGRNKIPGLDLQPAVYEDVAMFMSHGHDALCIVDSAGNVDSTSLSRFSVGFPQEVRRSPALSSPLFGVVTVPSVTLGEAVHLANDVWTEELWDLGSTDMNDRMVLRSRANANTEELFVPVEVSTGVWHHRLFARARSSEYPWYYPSDLVGNNVPVETVQGKIHLPRITNPDYDLHVTQITIDARYWQQPSADSIQYDPVAMTVSVADTETTTNHTTVLGPGTDVLSNLADGDGKSIRLVASPGKLPPQSWSEVHLDGIQSMAVEQVMVEYELSARRSH